MVTQTIHESFSEMTADEFRAYATALLDGYPTASERQRAQSYLQQIAASDSASHDGEQDTLNTKRRRRRQHQAIIEELAVANAFDFADKAPELFVEQEKTDGEILTLLQSDGADVSIRNRNITGTVSIQGNNVRFTGLGHSGNAVDGTLACTCIVTGQIKVSGNKCVLKGIHFKSSVSKAIIFEGACNSLRLKDCIFENTGDYAAGMWIHGGGNHLSGVCVVNNCVVKNFGSWMLADPTTPSGTATTRLATCTFNKNKFENCAGSIAVRGMQDQPNGKVKITNNLWAFGAGGMHDSFWSCVESNNQKELICHGNTVTGASRKEGGTRGFLQCWSRSSVPWTLTMHSNTISGLRIVLQCACIATFYSPNTQDADYRVDSAAGEITDVTYGASFVYDWLDETKQYEPENQSTFDDEPATNWADDPPNFERA